MPSINCFLLFSFLFAFSYFIKKGFTSLQEQYHSNFTLKHNVSIWLKVKIKKIHIFAFFFFVVQVKVF